MYAKLQQKMLNSMVVELIKVFHFSDKEPGFLEMIDLWHNLGIRFCITWLVLPNYKKSSLEKTNFKLTT